MANKLCSRSELTELSTKLRSRYENKTCVAVCGGTGCEAYGAGNIAELLAKEIATNELSDHVVLLRTGCHGYCERGPIVLIQPGEICYLKVQPEDVPQIVSDTVLDGKVIERLLYADRASGVIVKEADIPFYKHQSRVVLSNNTKLDPTSIEDYIALGGYAALDKSIHDMSPEQVVEMVTMSKLRGRGGGGFSAGVKWQTTRDADDPVKYVVVNADEGDPGAYMDRSLLEGNPHLVLEGLAIGAYAIGAKEGFVYVRQEYPLALKNLSTAIDQARDYGLLGKDILGTDFSFDITVHRGAGAFVSGESSALMTALEGKAGEPRLKYTRTSVSGLWDHPTNLNNVETWANVPMIIEKGDEWFRKIGTKDSPGTKIFSLVGKVQNTGLVEVPMGTTLKEIIYDIGGGIRKGKAFKAVQTGGPSGGVLPESMLSLPVDFDTLAKHDSMMGSGGMIVMDEDSCMVDVAKYFVEFLREESCGKCIPCREGISEIVRVLNRITEGNGKEEDLDFLGDIGEMLSEASLCALGATAANPLLSTIKYFHDEYLAHIRDKCCPAGVCKELLVYAIDADKCNGCTICAKNCPVGAIEGTPKEVYRIDTMKCTKCGVCFEMCPERFRAVQKLSPVPVIERQEHALAAAGKEGA